MFLYLKTNNWMSSSCSSLHKLINDPTTDSPITDSTITDSPTTDPTNNTTANPTPTSHLISMNKTDTDNTVALNRHHYDYKRAVLFLDFIANEMKINICNDIKQMVYNYVPYDCMTCHTNHKKTNAFLQCYKNALTDVLISNHYKYNDYIINYILNKCLNLTNKCQTCNKIVHKFYKYFHTCDYCYYLLCDFCINDAESNGMFYLILHHFTSF